jgi:Raf kinase inhibitor-like YbhB/YbcL family protein
MQRRPELVAITKSKHGSTKTRHQRVFRDFVVPCWSLVVWATCTQAVIHAQQKLVVGSPTLKAGAMMPRDYTPDGKNVSPPLTWSNVPAGTREFAVVCEDFDAGNPPPFVHWVIYKIPATATGLPENIPIDPSVPMPAEIAGTMQGLNGFKRAMYRGPAPPAGKPHGYHFVVYALDAALNLKPNLTRAELLEAIKGHVLAQGEIVPTYERRAMQKP